MTTARLEMSLFSFLELAFAIASPSCILALLDFTCENKHTYLFPWSQHSDSHQINKYPQGSTCWSEAIKYFVLNQKHQLEKLRHILKIWKSEAVYTQELSSELANFSIKMWLS